MAETFVITASYKNQQRDFDATFTAFGFSYRIEVVVDGQPVVFEPDEEKKYRAYLPPGADHVQPLPDPLLLKAIAEALEKAFR
jgi:hypothetical protein